MDNRISSMCKQDLVHLFYKWYLYSTVVACVTINIGIFHVSYIGTVSQLDKFTDEVCTEKDFTIWLQDLQVDSPIPRNDCISMYMHI